MKYGLDLADTRMARVLYTIAGTVSFSLGAIGVALPVLPTTPFLLLSAYCYSKGSAKLHHWLLNHRIFGEYIRNYVEGKGMRKRSKYATIVFLWSMLIISMNTIIENNYIRALLLFVGITVTAHIVTIPDANREEE